MCAVVRTTYELQQAQLADPMAALQYEHQLATQAAEPIEHEPSPAPQAEATPQLDPAYSLPHPNARESTERQAQVTEDTDAPGTSAAHSRPASLGWGRLKKVKLAAKADGSQDVGSKRKWDPDTGGYAKAAVHVHTWCSSRNTVNFCEVVLFIRRGLDCLIRKAVETDADPETHVFIVN